MNEPTTTGKGHRSPGPGQPGDIAFDMPIDPDPLYRQALSLLQEGRWQESGQALQALERHYPASVELCWLRQSLDLHLSAEQSWGSGAGGRLRGALRAPAVRVLLFANLLLYLLLGALWVSAGEFGFTL